MTTRDPLEQFRRGGQQPPAQRPTPPIENEELDPPPKLDQRTGKEVYEAYRVATTRRVEHLEIRPALAALL